MMDIMNIILDNFTFTVTRLGRMVQSGLVGKWHRDEVTKLKQSAGRGKDEEQGGSTSERREGVSVKPLALDHIQVSCFSYITY